MTGDKNGFIVLVLLSLRYPVSPVCGILNNNHASLNSDHVGGLLDVMALWLCHEPESMDL